MTEEKEENKDNEDYSKQCEVLLRKFLIESDRFMISNSNVQIGIEEDIVDYFKENNYFNYLCKDNTSWMTDWILNAVTLHILSNMKTEVFQGRFGKFKLVETEEFFIAMEVKKEKEERKE